MKNMYSYFLVKPDGIKFLPEIVEQLESEFQSIRYFKVEDFSKTIKSLYYRHYERKGKQFAQAYEQYLYGLNELFGNQALVALVSNQENKKENYTDFCKKVLNLKIKIRDEYASNNVGIITNFANKDGKAINRIQIVDENGNKEKQRIFKVKGNYRISDLNIIHCPDADVKTTIEELKILCQKGIIDDKNMISRQEIDNAIKYKSIYGSEANINEPKPDISGFFKDEIQKMDEEER